jgi:acetyl esterase
VGGNLTAALTLLSQQRGGPRLGRAGALLPGDGRRLRHASYDQFAEGYFLTRQGMRWFWDQYTTDPQQRAESTVSPLRAPAEQLAGLPPALVITAEADVLRDEGEAYAARLREAGVPVVAVRYQGSSTTS